MKNICDFGISKNFRSEKTLIIRANNDKLNFKKIKNFSSKAPQENE